MVLCGQGVVEELLARAGGASPKSMTVTLPPPSSPQRWRTAAGTDICPLLETRKSVATVMYLTSHHLVWPHPAKCYAALASLLLAATDEVVASRSSHRSSHRGSLDVHERRNPLVSTVLDAPGRSTPLFASRRSWVRVPSSHFSQQPQRFLAL